MGIALDYVITRVLIRGSRGRWDGRRGEGEVLTEEMGCRGCDVKTEEGRGRPLQTDKSGNGIHPWSLQEERTSPLTLAVVW